MQHKLAFIGFGGVGQGLAEILVSKQKLLRDQQDFNYQVVAVSDPLKGAVYDPNGLDVQMLLDVVRRTGDLADYPDQPELIRGWDSFETIQNCEAHTIVEVTYTDVKTGQPAIDHCKAAFEKRMNVIMTNKGPLALAYDELSHLAESKGVYWGFEGTVMSGTPALRMPLLCLAGNEVREIRGILNKTVILANVVMGVPLNKNQVVCQGIDELSMEDIEQAKREGKRWKLLARLRKVEGNVQASVRPEKHALSDSLANIGGAVNAITYDCDLSGEITLVGAGAGRIETGYALLIDLLHIVHSMKQEGGMSYDFENEYS